MAPPWGFKSHYQLQGKYRDVPVGIQKKPCLLKPHFYTPLNYTGIFSIHVRSHNCEKGGFECKNSTITYKSNEYAKIKRL